MNAEQLRKIIAKMVRAEMQPIMRQEVRSYLSEVFSGKAHRPSNRPTSSDSDETVETEELPSVPQRPKKRVNYTNNPALNAILNETTGGIPQEGSMASMMGGFGGSSTSELINETAMPVVVPETAPEPVKNVAAVINRDFRSLMKAIDKKVADKKRP